MSGEKGIDRIIKEGEKKKLTIQGEEFEIGILGFRQLIKLTKYIIKMFVGKTDRLKNIKTSGETIHEDITVLMEVFNEDELLEVACIVLNRDKGFCENLTGKEYIDIVTTVIDFNYDDFKDILKKVQRTAGILQAPKMNP